MSAMPKSRPSPIESFLALTPAERREATAVFDQEFVADQARPMTPQQRAEWEQIQRRLRLTDPHPQYRRVMTRLSRSLIKELDAMAKRRKVSRSKVIALALSVYVTMTKEEADGH